MEFWPLFLDIGVILAAALVLGALCERLRQSAILGYLLAGTLLGPNALDIVATSDTVDGLAEVGVSLLLFSIGLEFSWARLRRMGSTALAGGVLQVLLSMLVFGAAARMLGVEIAAAFVLGAAFSLSSTAAVLRMLSSRTELESVHGRHALGILLFQDLAVIPLVLVASFLENPAGETGTLGALGRTVLMLALAVVVLYAIFNHVAPRLLLATVMLRNRELPILFAVVGVLASIWLAHQMGFSPAMGAFIAGILLAESPYATQIRADLASLRTLLVTLFFSSIGMLADPAWMLAHAGLIAAIVAGVLLIKAIVIWVALRAVRQPHVPALAAGICLGQVGEFGFVIAVSAGSEIVSPDLFMVIVSTMIVTLFLTPTLVTHASGIAHALFRKLGLARPSATLSASNAMDVAGHIVLVGFGPAGASAGEVLGDRGLPICALDLNPDLVRLAREEGFEAHVGDATHPEVLDHYHVETAAGVLVTIPDPHAAMRIVRLVRSRAPGVPILVRARYRKYRADLEAAGATVVVDEEGDVGTSLGERFVSLCGGAEQLALAAQSDVVRSADGADA